MQFKKNFFLLALIFSSALNYAFAQNVINIPLGGNAFIVQGTENGANISNKGLTNWSSENTIASIYFYVAKPQRASVLLILNANNSSKFTVKLLNKIYSLSVNQQGLDTIKIADVNFKDSGYVRIDIQGKGKNGDDFGNIQSLLLQGTDVENGFDFVKDKKDFYFGRRGPSVHWVFVVPKEIENNVAYFYNEIYVPKGNDVIGSYFEADGFSYGYFGMQVNSEKERHVLFSIWSPYKTDNPNDIPDSEKIILIKKGENVFTHDFGNEGSGGQSYLNYDWKPDTHYAFLIKAQPNEKDSTTIFTAYFKEANAPKWLLIASFKRPKTFTYLKGLYSFLENFQPDMGNVTRGAYYCNQWVCDVSGKWYAIKKALFTTDHKVQNEERHDYTGSSTEKGFYLQNCGFFNGDGRTIANTFFDNKYTHQSPPQIDFDTLP